MSDKALLLLMTALGLGLGVNPYTNVINPRLLKGATWLFRGIIYKLLK